MSIKSLQTKIGATADGAFGPKTMKAAMAFYNLTPERAAHFFGQTSHETGVFRTFSENLNYSADGLKKIFKKYFNNLTALAYARNPEKIANKVYGNRMGNGTESSGDGYKFRGRGALQLTGRSNYESFAEYLGKPEILLRPEMVADEYAFESAMFFFDKNKLWDICDKGVNNNTILKLTKRINGGTNGLEHRTVLTNKYYKLINQNEIELGSAEWFPTRNEWTNMKATLTFDLNDQEEADSHLRCIKAAEMAGFIWQLKNNFWRKWKHNEEDFTLDNYKEALAELLDEHNINVDELY